MSQQPILLSGIQPSGQLMIGNYFGAIKHWLAFQKSHDCFFFVVDLHTLTVAQNPTYFADQCLDAVALYLACGLDAHQHTLFLQSHVPEHAELAWILNCFTSMGALNRMTQFKDKSKQHAHNINVGLFTYPVLQAADILLYQANTVPVGEDQRQHLELTRDLAIRFNQRFSPVFVIPEAFIPSMGARLMSLQDPSKKMSKTDENAGAYLALLDTPDVITKKLMRSVTDSETEIRFDPDHKPGVSNLLTLLACLSERSPLEVANDFKGQGYGQLKQACADAVIQFLTPIQEKFAQIRPDLPLLNQVLETGKEKASAQASHTLKQVKRALGMLAS